MYPGTRRQGKSPRSENATLTAGFRWAPDTLPMNMMIAITISPGATTAAVRVIVSGNACPIMPPPAATRTRKNVPKQLREQPAPLLAGILEVLQRVNDLPIEIRQHPGSTGRHLSHNTTPSQLSPLRSTAQ